MTEPDFRVARGLNSPPPMVEPAPEGGEPIDVSDEGDLPDEDLTADELLDAEFEEEDEALDASP
ncbi:MAG: hypothetical protein EPO26_15105 [Chloroflexota bacterium]|nr:MAG: hypothetical protein EPO26_15105 [Chloroflexota bacterium]